MTQAQFIQQHCSFDQQNLLWQYFQQLRNYTPSGIRTSPASPHKLGYSPHNTTMAQSMLDYCGQPQTWTFQQAELDGTRPQSGTSNNTSPGSLAYPCAQDWNGAVGFGGSHTWNQDGQLIEPYIMSASQFHRNNGLVYNAMAAQNTTVKEFGTYDGSASCTSPKFNGLPGAVDVDASTSVSPKSYLSDDLEDTYSPGSLPGQTSPVPHWQSYPQSVQPESYHVFKTESPTDVELNGLPRMDAMPAPLTRTPFQHGQQSSSKYSYLYDSSGADAPWYHTNYPHGPSMSTFAVHNAESYNVHSASNTSASSAQGDNSIQSHQTASYPTLPTHNQPQVRFQTSTSAANLQAQRAYNDNLLIEGKKKGLTYKDIRKKWKGVPPKESTMRGRHRSLTKARKDRVRKPVWTANDVVLLNEIVQQEFARIDNVQSPHSFTMKQKLGKVAWKRVAEYIQAQGGSYHFGNSTCKKKWEDIHGVTRNAAKN